MANHFLRGCGLLSGLSSLSDALTACPAGESVPELRIGGFPGPRGQTAFQLWANWVNANSATAGHTVALDFAAYDAATYEAGTTAGMANWDIVIPPYGSRQSDNVVLAVNGAKPILVWGGASEYIFEHAGAAGAKVFGTFTPASRYFDSGLQAVSDGGATTVAFVENDSSFSSAVCTAAIAKATELGMTNEGAFTYSRCADAAACTTDENAAIATTAGEVAATAADAVVNCGHEADVVQIVLALNALPTPFCPKAMLATNGLMNRAANYVGNNSGLPRGIMMPTQWSSLAANVNDPITGWSESQFITAYQALDAADASPTYHAASAVLAGLSITAAMQTLSGAAYTEATFLTAMRAVDVTTVVGRVKFSQVAPVGANTLKPMMTEQFQTEHEIVAPCAIKTEDPVYPRVCGAGDDAGDDAAALDAFASPCSLPTVSVIFALTQLFF